jgi:hypothetical protein
MLSPSDIVVRAPSLTERLAVDASAEPPRQPEPTPTSMAERFAPEAQKGVAEAPSRPIIEPPPLPGFIPERGRAPSSNRGLLLASMLVSLVPTAIILALLWQGAIKIPGANRASIALDQDQFAESEHAALAAVPSIQLEPKAEVEPKAEAEIVLTAPSRLEAKTGGELAFDITIDSADALPARSVIAIRAMPEGATFSQGRPYGASEWNLTPDEIGDLRLKLPRTASGSSDLRVELMAADGTILASASTRLDIAPDPKAALILRADESSRIADLIAHGQKMIDVGYFAGARAYFKRAAEAGSGDAALRLAATYDQDFIEKIGAQGIKADPKEASSWYGRAKQLGVEEAEAKLAALKNAWADHGAAPAPVPAPAAAPAPAPTAAPAPAAEATAAPSVLAEAEPSGEADPSISGIGIVPVPAAANLTLPAGKDEWVALVGYANVRAAPSSNADTLRVAEKGAKLLVTGRKGNWVQVTDPRTAEVGWVYSRFIETAQSPAR